MSCSLDTAKKYLMRKGAIDSNMVLKMPTKYVNHLVNILTKIAKNQYHIDRGPLFTVTNKRLTDYISQSQLVPNTEAFWDIDESGLIRKSINPSARLMDRVDLVERGTQEEPYFEIQYDGENVGHLSTENDGSNLTSELVGIRDDHVGKGIGTVTYLKLAKWAQERGLQLRSDRFDGRMSEAAIGLWERFVRNGQAEKSENRYIFVQDLQDQPSKLVKSKEFTFNTKEGEPTVEWKQSLKIEGDEYAFTGGVYINDIGDDKLITYFDIDYTVNNSEELIGKDLYERKNKILPIINNLINKAGKYTIDYIRIVGSDEQGTKKAQQRVLLYKRVMDSLGLKFIDFSEDKEAIFYEVPTINNNVSSVSDLPNLDIKC